MLDQPVKEWELKLKEARMERKARLHYLKLMEIEMLEDLVALRTEAKVVKKDLISIETDLRDLQRQ